MIPILADALRWWPPESPGQGSWSGCGWNGWSGHGDGEGHGAGDGEGRGWGWSGSGWASPRMEVKW